MLIYPYLFLGWMLLITSLEDAGAVTGLEKSAWTFHVVALAVAVYSAVKGVKVKHAATVKIVHAPFYVLMFAVSFLFTAALGSIGLMVGVLAFLVDLPTIIISGIYMLGVRNINPLYKVLGFIFVLDVIVAIKLLIDSKPSQVSTKVS